jgi:hypothetical protein
MAGGGVRGVVVGIGLATMIVVGLIMAMFRVFIMTWTQGGEDTIEIAPGAGIPGTMSALTTTGLTAIGTGGGIIDTGKGSRRGACRTIDQDRSRKDRS